MEAKFEINIAEAIECYFNLIEYNKINCFRDSHPSCVFAEKLHTFLTEQGVEI